MALYLYLRMKGTKCGLLDAETKVRFLRAAKNYDGRENGESEVAARHDISH